MWPLGGSQSLVAASVPGNQHVFRRRHRHLAALLHCDPRSRTAMRPRTTRIRKRMGTLAEKLELHVPPRQGGCYPAAADGYHPEGWAGSKSHAPSIVRVQSDVEGDRRFRVSVTPALTRTLRQRPVRERFSGQGRQSGSWPSSRAHTEGGESPGPRFSTHTGGCVLVKAYVPPSRSVGVGAVRAQVGGWNFRHLPGGPEQTVHAEL